MKRAILAATVLLGCGTDPQLDPSPDAGATSRTGIEACIAGGGSLGVAWSANNQHGNVLSIALAGETIVLTSEDGSVKTWDTDGTGAEYGARFADTGPVVSAVAYGTDDRLVGVTADGALHQWKASTKEPLGTMAVGDAALSKIAVAGDVAVVAVGPDDKTVRTIALASATASAPLATQLWGVGALLIAGTNLYAAGHYYSMPTIERWDTSAPFAATDSYRDEAMTGGHVVRALAIDPDETVLVAAGDGFVDMMTPGNLAGGPRASAHDPSHHAVGAVVLPGKELVATVGSEGTLQLWRVATGEHVSTLPIAPSVGLVVDAAAKTLYTSGPDGILRAFNCR